MHKTATKISVIHEDDDYIVIDKPSGLLVQAKGKLDNEYTVVDFIKDKTTDDGIERPGLVHRLDRGTSGLMLLAKSKEAREFAQNQFAERAVEKTYIAVAHSRPKNEKFIIDLPIQRNPKVPSSFRVNPSGKSAQSFVEVLSSSTNYSLLKIMPKTGRTHQIRVHLQYIGCPIVNDSLYAASYKNIGESRLMLHAQSLKIKLLDGKEHFFEIKPDTIFEKALKDD